MNKKFDWFMSIMKVAGASFPVSSSIVQFLSEIESEKIKERLEKLEDPISNLHSDIPQLSELIYKKLSAENSTSLEFSDEFYQKYSKPLATLEAKKYIKGNHTIGNRYQSGIQISEPTFIMYLCRIAEDEKKMNSLIGLVENCEFGKWLDGEKIDLDLPLPVINAVFEIYESKGYGICSNEVGICRYMCKA